LAIRKHRGQYLIEFELKGNRVFRRLPAGATKAQAETYELSLRRGIVDQAMLGYKPLVSVETAVKGWLEEIAETKSAKPTSNKAGIVLAALDGSEMLTPAGILVAAEKVLAIPRERGKGPLTVATQNRRLSVLKGSATWAWKVKQWTAQNMSPYVRLIDKSKENVRTRKIDQQAIKELIAKGRHFEARAFMAFGAYALMREGEVKALRKADIGREGISLPDSKNGEPRVVPIIPQLQPYLKAVPFTRHVRTYYAWFEEARDAAGVKDLVYHDLRRSGATILLNAEVPLEIVAAILGNSLDVARKHYAHVLNQTTRKAMLKGFKPIKIPSGDRK
jgi:integrase